MDSCGLSAGLDTLLEINANIHLYRVEIHGLIDLNLYSEGFPLYFMFLSLFFGR